MENMKIVTNCQMHLEDYLKIQKEQQKNFMKCYLMIHMM